jgi:hypothetical protein
MRKSVTALLLVVVLIFSFTYSTAEDLSSMSTEELMQLRQDINDELSSRTKQESGKEDSTIAELFPDSVMAKYIRDAIGAFSTKDVVSQEQLDTIEVVRFLSHDDGVKSLEGIQYLHNLEELSLYWQEGLKDIPESIGTLTQLKEVFLEKCGISSLPESITNLVNLTYLVIAGTEVSALPDDIGNLTSLKDLDISDTKITKLPESIYNLKLDTFLRKGLNLD